MQIRNLILFIPLFMAAACGEQQVEFRSNQCKKNPPFVARQGFNPGKSFFVTNEVKTMGLVLAEGPEPGNIYAPGTRVYQHPGWRMGGWLAPILIDESGNLFTAPAPFINILNNETKNQNTIYRIDAQTGLMEEYMKLPLPDSLNSNNPYGIIGMAYLCESGTLYVSSIAGSNRHLERGRIFAVNLKEKKIIDQLTDTDAMGMGISYRTGRRQLFFGTGRSSDIFSLQLQANGKFSGRPQKACSLEGLGPRGDDKVRRITTDQYGNLQVAGIEFNYNLIPAREKLETTYRFVYNDEEKKWQRQ